MLNLVLVGGFAALLVVSGAFNYKYLTGVAHRGANAPAGAGAACSGALVGAAATTLLQSAAGSLGCASGGDGMPG